MIRVLRLPQEDVVANFYSLFVNCKELPSLKPNPSGCSQLLNHIERPIIGTNYFTHKKNIEAFPLLNVVLQLKRPRCDLICSELRFQLNQKSHSSPHLLVCLKV